MIGKALKGRAKLAQHQARIAQADAPKFQRVTWWKDSGLLKLYFWCAILMVSSASTGFDAKLMNTCQIMDQWQQSFGHPGGGQLGIIVAILDIGALSSFWMVPFFADRYGRKVPIMIGCVIEFVGTFVSTFSKSTGMFMAGRFILGFGGSFMGVSNILIAEIAHPQHRAIVSAIVNCMYGMGSTWCSWSALANIKILGDWSWRSLTVEQCIPGVLIMAAIYWIPESPRWLVSKDRHEEAEEMLAYYHGNGDKENETVVFEYHEIKDTLAVEFRDKKSSSYLDFFRTPGNRYRVMLLISLAMVAQYSGSNLFSNYANKIYTNAGINGQVPKLLLSGGQSMLSLVVSVTFSLFIDRFGRRPLFLTSTAGIVLSYMGWTIISSQFERTADISRFGYPQIAFIWLFAIAYQIAWNGVMNAYSLEIIPFYLRAKASVITTIAVRSFVVLGSYTNPIALDNLGATGHAWALAMMYTILNFCYLCFVYFFYPETKNLTLEEVAKVFDGDQVIDDGSEMAKSKVKTEKDDLQIVVKGM